MSKASDTITANANVQLLKLDMTKQSTGHGSHLLQLILVQDDLKSNLLRIGREDSMEKRGRLFFLPLRQSIQ